MRVDRVRDPMERILVLDVELPLAASRIHPSHGCESESIGRWRDFAFPVRVTHITRTHLTPIGIMQQEKSMSSARVCVLVRVRRKQSRAVVLVMSHSHRPERSCGISISSQ